MDRFNYRSIVMKQLKRRNTRESSFRDIIKYGNKLLESVDFLQKASIPKCLKTVQIEENISDDYKYKVLYGNSKKELAECLAKISSQAEQVNILKVTLEDIVSKHKAELKETLSSLETEKKINVTLKAELINLRKVLQDKSDELIALNITYSSIDNRKNDLELENRKLQEQLLRFKELEKKSSSSESFESVFSLNTSTGSSKSPQKYEKTESVEENIVMATKMNFNASHFCLDVVLPAKVKYKFEAHNSEVNAILWFPDSLFLFTAGADRRVKLWEMSDSDVKLIKSVCDCNMSVMSLDIDSEASLLVCSSLDFASRIWTTSDFTLRHTLTGHSGKVTSSKFLKDSHKVVSGSADQSLKLWDFRRRVCTTTYESTSPVTDVISKDSNLIVSGHMDNKIRLWDMRTKSQTSSFLSSGTTTSLDASLKNQHHVLVSEQGTNCLKLFDVRTGKESLVMTAKDFVVGCNWTRAKISPDGKYSCCGSKNGSVFVWNTSNGALVRELKSHKVNAISCSWSICGSYLATCDGGSKCILWSK